MGESVKITYESLFELFRNEKDRDELQKLDENFLQDVSAYVKEKQKSVQKSNSQDMFSEEEKQSTNVQIINIKKILKALYQKRETKIVMMALNKSRTGTDIVDTSALLKEEKELFKDLTKTFDKYRSEILLSMFRQAKKENSEQPEQKEEEQPEAETEESGEEESQEEEQKKTKIVRFLNSVPKFMGKDLQVYGPFDEEDVATLPEDVADLLIKKGRVEELQE
ncbi:MAG: hypothetical protein ACQEP1_06705 [Nanobdellota archaeon]